MYVSIGVLLFSYCLLLSPAAAMVVVCAARSLVWQDVRIRGQGVVWSRAKPPLPSHLRLLAARLGLVCLCNQAWESGKVPKSPQLQGASKHWVNYEHDIIRNQR